VTRPLVLAFSLLAAAVGCGGSVQIGTDPETAAQPQPGDDAEIPTAGIDRETEAVPLVTVDIEPAPAEPASPEEGDGAPD
jgi:hypothetical protein